jgi:hypothetical protein
MKQPVEDLMKASRVNLSNGGVFDELQKFQEYFSDYKIIVYDGSNPDRVMFNGNSVSAKTFISYMMRRINTTISLRT